MTEGAAVDPAAVASKASVVRIEHVGAAAHVVLDSPANRNALSGRLRTQLFDALAAAGADSRVRCVVLTHTGTVFCAGADLKEAQQASELPHTPSVPEIIAAIWECPKPVIAAVSGVVRAGGVGIVAACDIVIAADDVTFACTEVNLGVVPAVISAVVLRRMMPSAAHHLFLTALPVGASWARQQGLVDSVIDRSQMDDEIAKYVNGFALAAPGALAATKALTRGPRALGELRQDLAAMEKLSAAQFASPEGREGIAAFVEKRSPCWAS